MKSSLQSSRPIWDPTSEGPATKVTRRLVLELGSMKRLKKAKLVTEQLAGILKDIDNSIFQHYKLKRNILYE